jgi:hypothetical protein
MAMTTGRQNSMSDFRILHTLIPAEGFAVRGALTELNGRLYGLAGECGPNGAAGCSSSASWQDANCAAS